MGSEVRKISFDKERVKALMKEKGIKQKDIALYLDRGLDTVKGYFRDRKILPEHLIKLADLLECDPDYLTGKTENIYENKILHLSEEKSPFVWSLIYGEKIDKNGYIIGSFKRYKNQIRLDNAFQFFQEWLKYSAPDLTVEDETGKVLYSFADFMRDWRNNEYDFYEDLQEEIYDFIISIMEKTMKEKNNAGI